MRACDGLRGVKGFFFGKVIGADIDAGRTPPPCMFCREIPRFVETRKRERSERVPDFYKEKKNTAAMYLLSGDK